MRQIRVMFWTLRCLHQPCVRRRTSTTTSSDIKVRHPVLNLFKAGNWALESVGFMTQFTPRRPLTTGHHSNDLVPLPAGTLPDHDALLRNIARPPPDMPAITAGGVVKRCANCSPSNHARRDSLCRCLARHVGDNITD